MANITFTSPLHKDKTVYAVADSHKETVLALAKENHVPIDFGCGNGECGTCLVKVKHIEKTDQYNKMSGGLTERETEVLLSLGKITREQVEQMHLDDIVPTEWRLACQMTIRDEDILVEYPSR